VQGSVTWHVTPSDVGPGWSAPGASWPLGASETSQDRRDDAEDRGVVAVGWVVVLVVRQPSCAGAVTPARSTNKPPVPEEWWCPTTWCSRSNMRNAQAAALIAVAARSVGADAATTGDNCRAPYGGRRQSGPGPEAKDRDRLHHDRGRDQKSRHRNPDQPLQAQLRIPPQSPPPSRARSPEPDSGISPTTSIG
jgi:hypothetical protein